MKKYKVVIPSAGLGSRIGPYTKFYNKALITVGEKPVISHIVEKFEEDVEIVVLIGYRGDHVRQVLKAAYPNRAFRFVSVDKYEGEGSGLGYTLNHARELLQCPFIFIPNDTIVQEDAIDLDPNIHGNWAAYYQVTKHDSVDVSSYRTLNIDEKECVTRINPKGYHWSENVYIGVCGVYDYEDFWDAMNDENSIEVGEAYGLKSLTDLKSVHIKSWYDVGNLSALEQTRNAFKSNEHNILEKENEAIWFFDNRVIKFHVDEDFISSRVKRLQSLPKNIFPLIQHADRNLYVYQKVEGNVISDKINPSMFKDLFETVDEYLWSYSYRDNIKVNDLHEMLDSFYRKKTYERVKDFFRKYEVTDKEERINGELVPKTIDLLDSVDWDLLTKQQYEMVCFHGDFHNENILVDKNGKYCLIDWRQNFGSKDNMDYGDIYYDFAKFWHGLIVPHKSVHDNQYKVMEEQDEITIDILRPQRLIEVEESLVSWLKLNGYNVEKTKILTALIFLNIAVLHEYPYSIFLYYLGRHLLYKWS